MMDLHNFHTAKIIAPRHEIKNPVPQQKDFPQHGQEVPVLNDIISHANNARIRDIILDFCLHLSKNKI